jgi:hypothetical protein
MRRGSYEERRPDVVDRISRMGGTIKRLRTENARNVETGILAVKAALTATEAIEAAKAVIAELRTELTRVAHVAGEAIGTDPSLRVTACIDTLVAHVEWLTRMVAEHKVEIAQLRRRLKHAQTWRRNWFLRYLDYDDCWCRHEDGTMVEINGPAYVRLKARRLGRGAQT